MTDDWVVPASPAWPRGVRALTTTRRWERSSDLWERSDDLWERSGDLWERSPDRESSGQTSSRSGDHSYGGGSDEPATVAGNRQALLAATGLRRVQWLTQVHGTACLRASIETAATVPEADAAWTREPSLGLAVLTADCVPVVVCDRQASLVAVAHGGWRGLVHGVLENLLAALPVPAGELVAWLGPAIGPTAYEVGQDVVTAVTALPDGQRLAGEVFRPAGPGKQYLNLFTLSERLLQRAGVPTVVSERMCTWSDGRFFSYRREGRTGRMATLAWLERAN